MSYTLYELEANCGVGFGSAWGLVLVGDSKLGVLLLVVCWLGVGCLWVLV